MKQVVRRNVFETNSSSCHSISISKEAGNWEEHDCLDCYRGEAEYNDCKWLNDEYIVARFGEFGWEICTYTSPYKKLQYLLTMMVETYNRHHDKYTLDDLIATEDFQMINEAVANYCNCKGVWIDEVLDNKDAKYTWHDGYIDHQSAEYESVKDFLEQECNGISCEDFIFCDSVEVHTDNDNY